MNQLLILNLIFFYLQLEILQRQVTNLADTQNNVEDRTSRTKAEYAVLQARYHMLEEQLREVSVEKKGEILARFSSEIYLKIVLEVT